MQKPWNPKTIQNLSNRSRLKVSWEKNPRKAGGLTRLVRNMEKVQDPFGLKTSRDRSAMVFFVLLVGWLVLFFLFLFSLFCFLLFGLLVGSSFVLFLFHVFFLFP